VHAMDEKQWKRLKKRMASGAIVLFLSPSVFVDNDETMNWLPLTNKGQCKSIRETIYHKESVAKRHAVFEGLQGPGILEMDYYGPLISDEIFIDQETPYETICAGFNTGFFLVPRGYRSSLLIAHHKTEEGQFILNTLNILANINTHPAADRLLLNLIQHARNVVKE
jgi:hypothetical protein